MNDLREFDPWRIVARRAGATACAEAFPDLMTRAAPGNPARAARVREAGKARQVYELWDTARVPPVGAEVSRERVTPIGSSVRGEKDGDARHG